MRCITSSKQDLLNMKRCQLLCWNGFNPPNAVGVGVFVLRYVSDTLGWLLGVCEGSVLVLKSESLFSIKKTKRKEIITSGSVCESCMPLFLSVPVSQKKATWRDITHSKDKQPWAGDRPHPERRSRLSQGHVTSDLWGRRAGGDISRHYVSGKNNCVFFKAASESCGPEVTLHTDLFHD